MGQRRAAKARGDSDRGDDHQNAKDGQNAAPPQEVADQAGDRRAQQVSRHGAHQRAPDRDLAFFGPDQITGEAECHRKHAAGADAGEDARCEQQPERIRHRAEDIGEAQQHQAYDHQPRLAEQIGGSAQHRLDDRKGEGEHGSETSGHRDADAELLRDVRQHRIQCARRQAGSEGRKGDDVKGRRQAA